jgi:hypothetical protein
MILAVAFLGALANLPQAPTNLTVRAQPIPQIWFSPRSGGTYATDFYNLFGAGAWPSVRSRVGAFEVSIQFETTDATDTQLTTVAGNLATSHIGLGLDLLALSGTNGCGVQVEGYADPAQVPWLTARLQRLSITPTYFGMDEPLFYGHVYSGQNACQSSLSTLTADIANKVHEIRSVFPGAQIGETEPLGAVIALDPTDKSLPNFAAWLDAFKAATGMPLAFFRLDMNWTNNNWPPFIVPLANVLHSRGIQLQVIYNGQPNDDSPALWAQHVAANAAAFEAVQIPDVAMFQSWNTEPESDLPETNPVSFTGIIKAYLDSHL